MPLKLGIQYKQFPAMKYWIRLRNYFATNPNLLDQSMLQSDSTELFLICMVSFSARTSSHRFECPFPGTTHRDYNNSASALQLASICNSTTIPNNFSTGFEIKYCWFSNTVDSSWHWIKTLKPNIELHRRFVKEINGILHHLHETYVIAKKINIGANITWNFWKALGRIIMFA